MLIAVLAAAAAWLAPGAGATSYTPSSYGERVVQLVNQARAQHGLPAVVITSGTSEVAEAWTEHLASAQALAHNPDLAHDLETHGSPDWTAYGENVGEAPTDNPDALFQAYMNSSEHRANILGSAYRYVGVGVVFTNGTAWNTLDFVDQYGSTATRPAARTRPRTASTPRPSTSPVVRPRVAAPVTAPRAAATSARSAATKVPPTASPRRLTRVRAFRTQAAPRPPVGTLVREHAGAPVTRAVALHVPLPGRPSAPAQLAVVVAAGLAGFVAVRWVAAVR